MGDCLVAEVKELGAEEVVTEELPAEEVVDDMGDDQPSSEDTE